ncbi:hypothetical protein COLO4_32998 [Corchorus olitorius]|uniref:F-box domain-containing protein n=1 Tax=Corchorus olitorius TaxID=93759 RepID=A0A1R3GWZ1_9ROSI|nr:hypothetical protein COLO4_32998 [Corchorus olitorius]
MESFRWSKKVKTMVLSKKSKTNTPNSAEQIGYNEDLLIEILLRVPSKSVPKFRFVSKQWRSLISSTRFRLSHARTLASLKPCALLLDRVIHSKITVLPLNPDYESRLLPPLDFLDSATIEILESCGGLLLCEFNYLYSFKYNVFGRVYVICNPTTREYKILPPPPPMATNSICFTASLALDPLKSPHYKIIYVSVSNSGYRDMILIYCQSKLIID